MINRTFIFKDKNTVRLMVENKSEKDWSVRFGKVGN